MIRWWIRRQLDRLERKLGAPIDYLRELSSISLSAFFKFGMFLPLASHGDRSRRAMCYAARLAVLAEEDCGECLQMTVHAARGEGVSPELLRQLLRGDEASLPRAAYLAQGFARALLDRRGDDAGWREAIEREFGRAALLEVSIAAATAAVFPRLKRGLGYASTCARTFDLSHFPQESIVQ